MGHKLNGKRYREAGIFHCSLIYLKHDGTIFVALNGDFYQCDFERKFPLREHSSGD